MSDNRTCTCHPDDNPPRPCPRKYALHECRDAELARLRAELESAENLLRKAASQHEIMFFDPATGVQRPFPSHAEQWREWNGLGVAWLFNPWTGSVRNAWDVGSDPRGLLIISPARNRALAQEPPA